MTWPHIPIPCPPKALGSPSWQGECPIDSKELGIDHLLPSTPLYDPHWGMGGQTLPFKPCSFRSDLLQPASQRIAWAVFQPPWAWCIQAWYMLEAPGTVLTALLCKIFLQSWFFGCLLGKCVLIQHRMSSFFCPCVLFFVHRASCRRAFQELFLIYGRQWNSEGYLCMAACRGHSLRHHSLTLAAIHLPHQWSWSSTANTITLSRRLVKAISKSKNWEIRVLD